MRSGDIYVTVPVKVWHCNNAGPSSGQASLLPSWQLPCFTSHHDHKLAHKYNAPAPQPSWQRISALVGKDPWPGSCQANWRLTTASVLSTYALIPKSAILARPARSISTFAGLMSLCTCDSQQPDSHCTSPRMNCRDPGWLMFCSTVVCLMLHISSQTRPNTSSAGRAGCSLCAYSGAGRTGLAGPVP